MPTASPPSAATIAAWTERVRAWRDSGQTAAVFADGKGFAPSTLRYWSTRLRQLSSPRIVPLLRAEPAPHVAPPELVVELAHARIRVTRGFDPALLADVVRALGGSSR